jgi:hypothetical protein
MWVLKWNFSICVSFLSSFLICRCNLYTGFLLGLFKFNLRNGLNLSSTLFSAKGSNRLYLFSKVIRMNNDDCLNGNNKKKSPFVRDEQPLYKLFKKCKNNNMKTLFIQIWFVYIWLRWRFLQFNKYFLILWEINWQNSRKCFLKTTNQSKLKKQFRRPDINLII